jgi:hypothetical protein
LYGLQFLGVWSFRALDNKSGCPVSPVCRFHQADPPGEAQC